MVGCVKYGLDCWMMDVEGKCSADAVARGLPVCTQAWERKGVRTATMPGKGAKDPEEEAEWGRSTVSGTKRLSYLS